MPFLPIVRVKNLEEGIARSLEAEHGYKHTSIIHSHDVEAMTAMGVSFEDEVQSIERKLEETKRQVYSNLTAWQRVMLARHPKRPYTLDEARTGGTEGAERHGERRDADDRAMERWVRQ